MTVSDIEFSRITRKLSIDRSTGCINFTGAKSRHGYGRSRVGGRIVRTHRAMFAATVGELPAGAVVMHKCDNPSCCNPAHLVAGTQTENNRDRSMKGRTRTGMGEQHGRSRLTDTEVAEARQAYASGSASQRELARRYGVTQRAIWQIVNNKTRVT